MRHCSSCHYCRVNLKAKEMLGVYIHECRLKKHNIVRPFWEGLRCHRYRKRK